MWTAFLHSHAGFALEHFAFSVFPMEEAETGLLLWCWGIKYALSTSFLYHRIMLRRFRLFLQDLSSTSFLSEHWKNVKSKDFSLGLWEAVWCGKIRNFSYLFPGMKASFGHTHCELIWLNMALWYGKATVTFRIRISQCAKSLILRDKWGVKTFISSMQS